MTKSQACAVVDSVDGTLRTLDDASLVAAALGAPHASVRARSRALTLLGELGSADGLVGASPSVLAHRTALTLRQAWMLSAGVELGRRVSSPQRRGLPPSIEGPADVAAWAAPRLSHLDHEELWMLVLDTRCRLRAARLLARGGADGLSIAPRDVLRIALTEGAASFVLVHNHPSGDPTPSAEDRHMTRHMRAAARSCGLVLADHIVVARRGHASALDS